MALEPNRAPVIRCVAQHQDCRECRTENLPGADTHVCDVRCATLAELRRNPSSHRRSHEPRRHHCGAVLDDRRGTKYELVEFCGWGTCLQMFCPGCKEFISGYGPAGCRCELEPCGHGLYAAYAGAPPVTTKRRGLFRRR